jgi:CheY-like chemotaxis protein
MSRVVLVHWNSSEANAKARVLKELGHSADVLCESEKPNLSRIRESPPDLFLIDLNRLPSHGREIAGYFRRLKSTRQVPILFVDGDSARVQRARDLIPDADFSSWERIDGAIPKAIRKKRAKPVVPATMAGYSGSPLPKKLGIREGHSVVLLNSPARFGRKLDPLPNAAQICHDPATANVAVLFAKSEADLVRNFRPLAKALPEKVAFWIAWPKKTSGIQTDLNENRVREFGLSQDWVDYKICAIDETWSGLCFARCRK